MQHHDVQSMALNPFAAVEKTAQRADRRIDLNAERVLDRVHAAHLVGDRANPADAGDNVEHLLVPAPAQQCLEEARRLEDTQSDRIYGAIANMKFERALAFDPRDIVDPNCPIRHELRFLSETPRQPR